MVQKIAAVISHSLSPVIILPVLLLMLVSWSYYPLETKYLSIFIIFGIGILPFILFFLYLKKRGKISDWEVRNRSERQPLYLFLLIEGALVIFLLNQLGVSQITVHLLLLVVWIGLMATINFVWKISGHLSAFTYVISILTFTQGRSWAVFFILIPFLVWSRIYRKNHTPAQAIGGVLLAIVFVIVANKIGFV